MVGLFEKLAAYGTIVVTAVGCIRGTADSDTTSAHELRECGDIAPLMRYKKATGKSADGKLLHETEFDEFGFVVLDKSYAKETQQLISIDEYTYVKCKVQGKKRFDLVDGQKSQSGEDIYKYTPDGKRVVKFEAKANMQSSAMTVGQSLDFTYNDDGKLIQAISRTTRSPSAIITTVLDWAQKTITQKSNVVPSAPQIIEYKFWPGMDDLEQADVSFGGDFHTYLPVVNFTDSHGPSLARSLTQECNASQVKGLNAVTCTGTSSIEMPRQAASPTSSTFVLAAKGGPCERRKWVLTEGTRMDYGLTIISKEAIDENGCALESRQEERDGAGAIVSIAEYKHTYQGGRLMKTELWRQDRNRDLQLDSYIEFEYQ